ncbi:MAG: radical SAM protein [Chitinophagaceae bacterium]|nr:radical SAM protein [Chitinophagaceae bacterium]
MKEKVSPFLKNIDSESIRRQYYINGTENPSAYSDPLMEDSHEVVKGLIHKYPNRALIKVSYQCASHCRFCTRIRQIGDPSGTLQENDIDNIVIYLMQHPEIEDVILSGGDPMYTPALTKILLQKIKTIESVKILRIGTRMPFQSPGSFSTPLLANLLQLIDEIGQTKPFYILVHIEHPDELTTETQKVLAHLRTLKVTLLSQTVFLKDINDSFDTLFTMFKSLYHLGVQPYYLYHCDNVIGLEHFRGDIAKEKAIAVQLREHLSGIACPLFVEDVENGYGKLPV